MRCLVLIGFFIPMMFFSPPHFSHYCHPLPAMQLHWNKKHITKAARGVTFKLRLGRDVCWWQLIHILQNLYLWNCRMDILQNLSMEFSRLVVMHLHGHLPIFQYGQILFKYWMQVSETTACTCFIQIISVWISLMSTCALSHELFSASFQSTMMKLTS